MKRREFLSLSAATALAPARKPNVIVILADDLGYADVGFQGCKDIPTPNLDRLAASGVRFSNACVSHPFCSPTRAGLMTGRYQQRFGHENNPRYDPNDHVAGLPLKEVTFPQVMKTAGYATGIVGKWHLGATPQFHPMRRGFDEMFGFIGGGHDYLKAEMEGNPREYLIPIQRDGKPVVETEHLTDAFSCEASAFVRRHRAHPFFLYLAYNAPHTPLQPPEKHLSRVGHIADETRRKYAAMVCGVDDGVGRLMSTLRETGLERDTLIFFLSDNGGPTTVTHSDNHPLRGNKGQVYEGGVRVPFLMRWSGTLGAGKIYSQPVISLDIMATAAAAGSAQMPADRKIDGVNLLPHVAGKSAAPPHDRLYFRRGGGEGYAVRERRYKLVKEGDAPPQLFDLEKDIGETTDIGAAQPAVRERLLRAYEEWNRELIPPLFESPNQGKKKA